MWGKWSKGLVSYLLKVGVVSQVYVAEGVNGGLEPKVVGQGVGLRSRVGVDGEVGVGGRFGGEVEGRTSRGVRSCVNG